MDGERLQTALERITDALSSIYEITADVLNASDWRNQDLFEAIERLKDTIDGNG